MGLELLMTGGSMNLQTANGGAMTLAKVLLSGSRWPDGARSLVC